MASIRIAGIMLELHWTFTALFVFLIVYLLLVDPQNFAGSMIFFIFLFLSVFLHELMHSVVALSKKINVKKIILLPIGGVSITEESIDKPSDEFLIAVAGPLFNFAVAFAIIILAQAFSLSFPFELFSNGSAEAFEHALFTSPLFALFWINLILGAFNLFVPAIPMDGGRVLRALLSFKLGKKRATILSTKISKIIAVFLFITSFMIQNIILMIIAVFIFIGSQQETNLVLLKDEIKKINLYDVITFSPLTAKQDLSVRDAFRLMKTHNKTALLLKGEPLKIVTLNRISGLKKDKWDNHLSTITETVPLFHMKEKKERLADLMIIKGFELIPVIEKGHLIGVVEREKLEHALEFEKVWEND